MNYTNARAAIVSQLANYPDLPRIAYENIDFKPEADETWLDFDILFGSSIGIDLLGEHEVNTGVAQFAVNAPLKTGSASSMDLITGLKSHFKRGRYTYFDTTIEVTSHSITQQNYEPPFYRIVLSITFRVVI
jgi:hypothetical protein